MSAFLSLPNECLLLILEQVFVSRLLSLRFLSHRLFALVHHILLRKRSLVLLGHSQPESVHNSLIVKSQFLATLPDHFPVLTNLSLLDWNQSISQQRETFSNLTHFSLDHFTDDLSDVLEQFSRQLTHLTLDRITVWPHQVCRLFQNGVVSSLTHLTFRSVDSTKTDLRIKHLTNLLENICTNCLNLEFFDVQFATNGFLKKRIYWLSRLPKLTTLKLYQTVIREGSVALFYLFNHEPLPALKTLHLTIDNRPNSQEPVNMVDFAAWIHLAFPNIERLELSTERQYLVDQIESVKEHFEGCAKQFELARI